MIIPKQMQPCVLGYNPINSRIITIKINAEPCNLNIVQVYAPTASSSEEEIFEFFHQLERTISETPSKEIICIQAGFNAKMRPTQEDEHIRQSVGRYGLDKRKQFSDYK